MQDGAERAEAWGHENELGYREPANGPGLGMPPAGNFGGNGARLPMGLGRGAAPVGTMTFRRPAAAIDYADNGFPVSERGGGGGNANDGASAEGCANADRSTQVLSRSIFF